MEKEVFLSGYCRTTDASRMVLYKRFRGQEPSIDALLKRNGIIN